MDLEKQKSQFEELERERALHRILADSLERYPLLDHLTKRLNDFVCLDA